MIIPTIHLNGTSRDTLLEQVTDAYSAVKAAIAAVQQAAPNGRDYYPQGNDAIGTAMREHADRIRKLTEVANELEEIGISL